MRDCRIDWEKTAEQYKEKVTMLEQQLAAIAPKESDLIMEVAALRKHVTLLSDFVTKIAEQRDREDWLAESLRQRQECEE